MSRKPQAEHASVSTSKRRKFLTSVGALGATGLTGCLGLMGDSQSSVNSFTFWDVLNVQSNDARQALQDVINDYESQSGATVDVNYSGYSQLLGSKWIQAFQQGEPPVLYDSTTVYNGRFIKGDYVLPAEEYLDEFDQETIDAISWVFDALKDAGRGFGGKIYEIPHGVLPRNPFVGRMDHFKAAGLDPKEDFPPKNFQHLLEVATTLQEDGPGDVGFQMFGQQTDWNDIGQPWAVAKGGLEGRVFNEDWTDVNFDKDAWITAAERMHTIYNKRGIGLESTPTLPDEKMVPLMSSGKVSLSMPEWFNHPRFMSQAKDMMMDGTIKYGPMYGGESGQRGFIGIRTLGLTRAPEGANQAEWEQRQKLAIDFMKVLLSKEFQRKMVTEMGIIPIRKDIQQELAAEVPGADSHNLLKAAFTMAETQKVAWEYHPRAPQFVATIPAANIQKMFKGELGPKEAMEKTAREARSQL